MSRDQSTDANHPKAEELLSAIAKGDISAMFDNLPAILDDIVKSDGPAWKLLAVEAFQAALSLALAPPGELPPEAATFLAMMSKEAVAPDGFRQLREAAGIDQDTFAEACGVGRSSVRGWENGGSQLPPEAFRVLFEMISKKMISGGGLDATTKTITGAQIRKLRTALGMSVNKLAAELGVTAAMVRKLENTEILSRASVRKYGPKLQEIEQRLAA
jgi:DNA-binding transcriptional regulator YiaG